MFPRKKALSIYQSWFSTGPDICISNKVFFSTSTVDCQLGPWTSCDNCCGSEGKTRFFGRMPKVEHTGDKCSQGATWQKCENLPPCAGIYL